MIRSRPNLPSLFPTEVIHLPQGPTVRLFNISDYLGDQCAPLPSCIFETLNEEEIRAARRFRQRSDLVRSALGRFLIRRELGSLLAIRASEVKLEMGQFGKPCLASTVGVRIEFNISHSGARLALATGTTPVGIDVEENRTVEEVESLVQRYLTADEWCALLKQRHACHSNEFLKYWTRKEAVLKALGSGLSRDPGSVSTLHDDDTAHQWIVKSIFTDGLFHCAVAWLR